MVFCTRCGFSVSKQVVYGFLDGIYMLQMMYLKPHSDTYMEYSSLSFRSASLTIAPQALA